MFKSTNLPTGLKKILLNILGKFNLLCGKNSIAKGLRRMVEGANEPNLTFVVVFAQCVEGVVAQWCNPLTLQPE